MMEFGHPYTPYSIQIEFMKSVYECLEDGKIGVFESPTGTGKSLSLLCGSLKWLRDSKERSRKGLDKAIINVDGGIDEPQWVIEQSLANKEHLDSVKEREFEQRLAKIRNSPQKEALLSAKRQSKKTKLSKDAAILSSFLVDEYYDISHSDSSESGPFSTQVFNLLKQINHPIANISTITDVCELLPQENVKIYFASRTHSQISQLTSELRKIRSSGAYNPPIKHITLASRKHLCINESVQGLNSNYAINEACLDMQKPNVSKEKKCPYLPGKNENIKYLNFSDYALSSINDIEDLVAIGKENNICPYYASRISAQAAEIITLPYPLILKSEARESLNITLENQIVIIDEAHNLLEALSSMNGCSVELFQLARVHKQIQQYLKKFATRLKGQNKSFIGQLLQLLKCLIDFLLAQRQKIQVGQVNQTSYADILCNSSVDQINIFSIIKYLRTSKLAQKVQHYFEHLREVNPHDSNTKHMEVSVSLSQIEPFLLCMRNLSHEGVLMYGKEQGSNGPTMWLKYMLLDVSREFSDVVNVAKSVILAGGTMQPTSDFTDILFPQITNNRVKIFSCGHIIPAENLLVLSFSKSQAGSTFNFNYENRNTTSMISSAGDALVTFCSIIPHGVVCFFPSYAYMYHLLDIWKSLKIYEQLSKFKSIFEEPKESSQIYETLGKYSSCASSDGALILCVVGGKLSEGINFADNLGRGIVVFGLPFPNNQSLEWKLKQNYIESKGVENCVNKPNSKTSKEIGTQFYENMCMNAVNQSIGRAIRHKSDWATILLIDERYMSSRIRNKLPSWIQASYYNGSGEWSSNIKQLKNFYLQHCE